MAGNNEIAIKAEFDGAEERANWTEEIPVTFKQKFWKLYDSHRTAFILFSVLIGFILGIILNATDASVEATSWIALPGDLFIRALKCVVLPLVFVNVVLAVIQMLEVGQAVSIGWKAVGLYMMTTFVAAFEGIIIIFIFKGFFSTAEETVEYEPEFMFQCKDEGFYISEDMQGSLMCMPEDMGLSYNNTNNVFMAMDVNGVFVKKANRIRNDLSISQTLQDGVFRKLVSQNIVGDFVTSNFASVIVFAMVFAVATFSVTQNSPTGKNEESTLLLFLQEFDEVMILLINWIIVATPIAVISLVAGALGGSDNLGAILQDLGVMIGASFTGMCMHYLFAHIILLGFITKENPFNYLKFLVPAQLFAFACASSAATIPVTTKCVTDSKMVPDTVRDFIIPLGATINMDGTTIDFPIAIVFLAVTSGLADQLNLGTYILIIFISAIGSAGAAPIPGAGLVLIITAFNTVFNLEGTPATFASIIAANFIVDRFETSLNVTGDMVVCRMVTALISDEELRILNQKRYSQVEEKIELDTKRRTSLYAETAPVTK